MWGRGKRDEEVAREETKYPGNHEEERTGERKQ